MKPGIGLRHGGESGGGGSPSRCEGGGGIGCTKLPAGGIGG